MKVVSKENVILKYNVVQDYPKKGVRFIDFTPTINDSAKFCDAVAALLFNNSQDFDYVIVPEARGFIWGSAFALTARRPLLIARKPGKIPTPLVGASVTYETEYSTDTLEIEQIDLTGKKVIYVDDVFATGGTYNACKQLVEKLGGKMNEGVVFYNVGITENKEVFSVFDAGEL